MILPGLPTNDLLLIMIPAGYHQGRSLMFILITLLLNKKYWQNSVSFAKDAVRTSIQTGSVNILTLL